jgi:hypothetical protein
MSDSDNVLLLRPARSGSSLTFAGSEPRRDGVLAGIYSFAAPVEASFVDVFEREALGTGASVLACFITEPSPNNFPTLPVRESEHVFVWLASSADEAALASISRRLEPSFTTAPEIHRLEPTSRSRLRG